MVGSSGNDTPATNAATEFHTILYEHANRRFFLEQMNRARNNLNRC
jgi:DNA-binding GntR family transcriptional regulator